MITLYQPDLDQWIESPQSMKCDVCTIGNRRQQLIRYNLTIDDRLVVVENVPAMVCDNCGEISIQPGVAAGLQKTIWERKTPARVIEAAVYEFSR